MSTKDFLKNKRLRSTLLLCAASMATAELSGSSCINFYSTSILSHIGLSTSQAIYVSIGMCMIYLLGLLLSVISIDRYGCRTLMLTSQIIIVVALTFFITFVTLWKLELRWAKYPAIASVFLFYIGFSSSLQPVPRVLPFELFEQDARPIAAAFINIVDWGSMLFTTFLFPITNTATGVYTFLFFIAFVTANFFLVLLRLPETKGKSILEIQQALDKL